MSLLAALFTQAAHLALLLLAAPVLAGVLDRLHARLAGRPGPPLRQPWTDLIRLARKTPVVPESGSVVLTLAPAFDLGATLAAAALVPSFTLGMALSPLADLLVIAGLLSLARVVRCLGGLDTGDAASGLAVQRSAARAVLAEPALLLATLGFGLMAGGFNLDVIVTQQRDGLLTPQAAIALAFACLLLLAWTDTIDPSAGPVADDCGLALAASRGTAWLRLLVWIDLIGALCLPVGMAPAGGGPLDWGIGLAAWAVRLAAAVVALAGVRAAAGLPAVRALPALAGFAALLALLVVVMALATT